MPSWSRETRGSLPHLTDGYKWRKYGEKRVKELDHPRSYYRCTVPGCPARKTVEISSTGTNGVLERYKDDHNHDKPQVDKTKAKSPAKP
eukprot:scaffold121149_cov24-Prasinocladus_malaysianus.AAC.1